MEQAQNPSFKIEEEFDKIRERFLNERETWRERIGEMASRLREIHNLAELQVDLYTSRQEAVEYQYNITMSIAKLESKLQKAKKKLIEHYNNQDIRYGKADLNQIIDGACADQNHHVNIMKSHSGYMYETIRSIDNMIFGIKHRIELENFRTSR